MKNEYLPMVSVIIAVYNGAEHIQACVESLLEQTYRNFEIIVIDDGSMDGTRELLQLWVEKGRLQYYYQENAGPAAARNAGLKISKGELVKFLDSDDRLYPRALELQVLQITQEGFDISAMDYDLLYPNGRVKTIHLVEEKDSPFASFIRGKMGPPHTYLIKKLCINRAGNFDSAMRTAEDYDLWLRMLMTGARLGKVRYVGCVYRIRAHSLSSDNKEMFLGKCAVFEKLNAALAGKIHTMSDDVIHALYVRNMHNVHLSVSLGIKPPGQHKHAKHMLKSIIAFRGQGVQTVVRLLGINIFIGLSYIKQWLRNRNYKQYLMREEFGWRADTWLMRQEPSNILYINSSAVMYGAETRLVDIIKSLNPEEFRPVVLLPEEGVLAEHLRAMGVAVEILNFRLRVQGWKTFRAFVKLTQDFIRLVKQHQIRLIHVNLHMNFSNFWLALLVLRLPVVVHLRSHFWLHIFEKFVICRTTKVLCVSEYVKRSFLQWRRSSFLMCHQPDHAEVVYDGVDIKRFTLKDTNGVFRKELGIDSNKFLVAVIGAIDQVKGQDIFVRAAASVVKKHKDVRFLIVGSLYSNGPRQRKFGSDLIALIKELVLEKYVYLKGFRNDIDIVMNEIDLLIQPSEREALGTSMIEAMACGKPVIGTEVDGIPEVIGKNEAGRLFHPRTAEQLAEDILYFVEHPDEAKACGERGRQRALTKFNVYNNVERIQAIYKEANDGQKKVIEYSLNPCKFFLKRKRKSYIKS